MDIRKAVLGGLVASTAVVLPISAARAAVAAPPPPPKTSCTPPLPPAPPKLPAPHKHCKHYKHHKHGGDQVKGGINGYDPGGSGGKGPGGSYGGNGNKTPPPGQHNHKPGNPCTCKPSGQAPPSFYSIFEPPSLSALYETWWPSYTCTPGKQV